VLSLFVSDDCSAQLKLYFELNESEVLKYKKEVKDSLSARAEINKQLYSLMESGYLTASIDRIDYKADSIRVSINKGNRYQWGRLNLGNGSIKDLHDANIKLQHINGKPVSPSQITNIFKRLLAFYENNGYPFAEIGLDSVVISSNYISASLMVAKGDLVRIDSIMIKGDSRLSRNYLYNYIGIQPGDIYNEKAIKNLNLRIKELPMISDFNPYQVSFEGKNALLTLFLNNRKASQFDGIIGLLPDANKAGKLRLSGELKLKLHSVFGRGELMEFNWKQPLPQTQDLKAVVNYPFLFSSPFGIDLGLSIYKKDTTYIDVLLKGGIQYLMRGNSSLLVFVSNKKSSLLSTSSYKNATVLPPYADMSVTAYGLTFKKEQTDYRLNPTHGYVIDLTASAGNKKIIRNASLNESLYQNLKLNTSVFQVHANADVFYALSSKMVFNPGISAAWMNAENVFINDQFRFGGLKSLRGFDEESLFATQYYLAKTELRYLLDRNSYLLLFYNQAYYASETLTDKVYDTPSGFGAGITFESKIGIFTINYALGKQSDNPYQFRMAKVHFGIINYF
jgi:outer membrane protein assembly factor BamA